MTYDCMTPEELAFWRAAQVHGGGQSPCVDCPAWFEAQAREAGCCNRAPEERRMQMRVYNARRCIQLRGRGRRYASDDERVEARRQSWRDCKRRARASQ